MACGSLRKSEFLATKYRALIRNYFKKEAQHWDGRDWNENMLEEVDSQLKSIKYLRK